MDFFFIQIFKAKFTISFAFSIFARWGLTSSVETDYNSIYWFVLLYLTVRPSLSHTIHTGMWDFHRGFPYGTPLWQWSVDALRRGDARQKLPVPSRRFDHKTRILKMKSVRMDFTPFICYPRGRERISCTTAIGRSWKPSLRFFDAAGMESARLVAWCLDAVYRPSPSMTWKICMIGKSSLMPDGHFWTNLCQKYWIESVQGTVLEEYVEVVGVSENRLINQFRMSV
jgi:hypothetical protein